MCQAGCGGLCAAMVVAKVCSAATTQTKNIKYFQCRVVSERNARMLSGSLVATRHSSRNLAKAHLSHFQDGSPPRLWTVAQTEYRSMTQDRQ
jgi:hypothetical protein